MIVEDCFLFAKMYRAEGEYDIAFWMDEFANALQKNAITELNLIENVLNREYGKTLSFVGNGNGTAGFGLFDCDKL